MTRRPCATGRSGAQRVETPPRRVVSTRVAGSTVSVEWLLALWDGLQYRWLHDRDGADAGGQLRTHLRDVLPDRS